ncbi:EEF1A lysine methyltransferase 2 [Condylostylus longicornis]|uniref:EEF1A lysine methyltransferase 2 n=1 Tax=Condylostylus longicornis TaxID=2530218 RepID=UPI00244DA160|nr:EEF1A lysine methyltransferase 2 [Condylostylus longicornis]
MEELEGSELGTKEYWDTSYKNELKNYKSHGDVGEIWFDEDSQLRILNWILKQNINTNSKIIDVGCGNAMFMIELAREGYKCLTGIDYSYNAIKLGTSIAKDQNIDIDFHLIDMLNTDDVNKLGKFDIVHDKGTYDAISLHPDNPKVKREKYIENISAITNRSGFFIITSCNWTETELINTFQSHFAKFCAIPTPSFKFGGKVGNVVSSIVFSPKVL